MLQFVVIQGIIIIQNIHLGALIMSFRLLSEEKNESKIQQRFSSERNSRKKSEEENLRDDNNLRQ